jgi:phenylpropionate dioxygenase-like ring-hydroxylating dioxygenase large terminal subunit
MEELRSELAIGQVVAVDVDGAEYVAWRGLDGRVRTGPRWCPHLDHDLSEGYVVGDELVCAGHAWAFDGDGNTYKRNEFGRVDAKGRVATLRVREHDDIIEFSYPEEPD